VFVPSIRYTLSMLNALANAILFEGTDDWVPMGQIHSFARRLVDGTEEARQRTSMSVVVQLITDGLVVAGEVRDGEGFIPLPGSEEHIIDQVKQRFSNWSPDDFLFWFANTARGNEIGAQVAQRK
jgi:hypothetical protein